MRITDKSAIIIQSIGGLAAAGAGSLLWLGSFGRVCLAKDAQGYYAPTSNGASVSASLAFTAVFFYAGFDLTGKILRRIVDVGNHPVHQAAQLRIR